MIERPVHRHGGPGFIVLFGSGEMSPTGGAIHESIIKEMGMSGNLRIGILETPTGFEVNALHGWPERMAEFFPSRLHNYKPTITRIHAWRKDDSAFGTNNEKNAKRLSHLDYLYCGAGSPSYTIRQLRGSRVYRAMMKALKSGTTLCLGSASAIAIGALSIPVYEIYKSGERLHWMRGLDLLSRFNMPNLVIVPHWNNQEGEDFDTTHCWMGETRFKELCRLLPSGITILGIDEQTACIIDIEKKMARVRGSGSVTVMKSGKTTNITEGNSFIL